MGKYLKIMAFEIKEKSLWNLILSACFIVVILFIFLHIWKDVLPRGLVDYSLPQMIWYLAFAEILMFSTGVDWVKQIGEDVRSGTLATALLKPINYVGMQLARLLGNFLSTAIVFSVLLFPVTWLMVGPFDFHIIYLPFILLTFLGAAILSFSLVIFLGLLAFWFEDASATYWIYQKFVFIAGGMLVPLDVLPDWLYPYIMHLPFSFASYMPTKLFIKFSWETFVITLIGQFIYSVIFLFLIYAVYTAGIKKVNINGG